MADEQEDFDIEDEYEVPEYQWTKDHAVHDLLWFATELQSATAQYFQIVTGRQAADSNYKIVREEMMQSAALEIESLPVFKEPEVTDG